MTSLETLLAAKAKAPLPPKAKGGRGAGRGAGAAGRGAGAAGRGVAKKPAAATKKAAGVVMPFWGYEMSRAQIMCRSGLPGPGQNHGIKFDDVGGPEKAAKLADAWVKAKKTERGL